MNFQLRRGAAPTDDDIQRLSDENPGYRFERGPDGALEVSPTGTAGGARDTLVTLELARWNATLDLPGVVFASSTGFHLPDGSLISPDGAWLSRARWATVPAGEREKYAHVVPEIAVEVVSRTDRPGRVREKLERCRRFGARYVVMLDPFRNTVWSDGEPPTGLRLDLETIALP